MDSTVARRVTSEQSVNSESRFSRNILPWAVASLALAVYLLTLNQWVSLSSLEQAARLAGWTFQSNLYGPLYWLLTWPLHWLPAREIPLALNLFSALCAALTLALLARSVALLPHDRTHEQRQREQGQFALLSIRAAWLPPVLAAMVCGLQLTFWENATSPASETLTGASSAMFDLLLFAYVVRCLLEFRIDDRQSWLFRAAFVFGLAMTNNWGIIGFFPLFLAALVWIKGLSFFNPRFLIQMAVCGLAGLLLYLLLPLVQGLDRVSPLPFWLGLKANLLLQKNTLLTLWKSVNVRHTVMLEGLFSLLPVFVIGIRWASYFGDTSKLGVALATIMFHVLHGFFLLACIWVALDPRMSPRHTGLWTSFLSFYYLGALCVGYFSGYFLLVFGARPERSGRTPWYLSLTYSAITGGIWLLLVVAPAALVYRNLPQIRTTNGPLLKRYATSMLQALPPNRTVVLSDDARRLWLLQFASAQNGAKQDYLCLDTDDLRLPDYLAFLRVHHRQRWPWEPPKDRKQLVPPSTLIRLVLALAQSNSLYYLHPSFGYYFEPFYQEAHGVVYKLNPYPTNSLVLPPPTQSQVQQNEAFWAKADEEEVKPLLAAIVPPNLDKESAPVDRLMGGAHLAQEPNREALVLGAMYSRALDFWGVELQRSGQLEPASAHFQRALALNPDNRAAQINLECNKILRAASKTPAKALAKFSKSVEDEFGSKARTWDDAIAANGPYDEPKFCYQLGLAFLNGGNFRQSANQFARAKALAPELLTPRLWLAELYIMNRMPDPALEIVEEIHAQPELLGLNRTNQAVLLKVEASAYLAKNDVPGAQAVVQAAREKYPGDDALLASATQVYMSYGLYSNALATIDLQLKLAPDNTNALVNKGYACLQVSAYEQAIPPLTRALALQATNYFALLNRAIAYLRSDQLEAARLDYEALQKPFPTAYQVYYGLGEIAYRQKNTNAAIRNYDLYLANASTNTAEAQFVRTRVKELKRR